MRHIITPDYGTLRGFTGKKKTSHLFSTMPAASEINACCPTSLMLPKQPEDSADGFNGLLLFMFITAQICHVNTNFFKSRQCRDPAATMKNMYFVCFWLCWKWREKHLVSGDFNRYFSGIKSKQKQRRPRHNEHICCKKKDGACPAGGLLFSSFMSAESVGYPVLSRRFRYSK